MEPDRLSRWVLLGSLLALLPTQTRAQALPTTMQVAMPDGVTLATDVWLPLLSQQPRPTLLRRTPYGRALDLNMAQVLANEGYAVVSQDVRGRGDSQGTFEPFFDDHVDGPATMAWIAQQTWSNGRVATYSNSAEGIVQFMAMKGAPEALRCVHAGMPTHDAHEGLFPGGAWRTELGGQWLTDLGAQDVIALWKEHEERDAYWDDARLSTEEMADVDHPVFILGGMFDIFAPSQGRALRELQTHAAPSARGDMFLVLGPWTHGGVGERVQGELLFPEDAPYTDWADDLLAYLRWCTQDGPRPDFPAVRFYQTEVTDTLGADPNGGAQRIVAQGSWHEADTWPPPEGVRQRLYLQSKDAPDGAPLQSTGVLGSAPLQEVDVELPVDPAAPLPSLGGGNLSTAAGPFDQAQLDLMPGVFVASSEPVDEPTELRGDPLLKLWASSATSDVDVIVRLEVWTEQGKAVALADGVRRGRFVHDYAQRTPLSPGAPVLFEVLLGPLAVKLAPGQALRIAISGTSSPRYEPNPNVADPLLEAVPTATTLTLHLDADHPSELQVPVVSGVLPGASVVPENIPDVGDGGAGGADAGAVASDAGAAPAGDASADAASPASDSGEARGTPGDGSGCACRAAGSHAPSPSTALLALGVVAWLRRRRSEGGARARRSAYSVSRHSILRVERTSRLPTSPTSADLRHRQGAGQLHGHLVLGQVDLDGQGGFVAPHARLGQPVGADRQLSRDHAGHPASQGALGGGVQGALGLAGGRELGPLPDPAVPLQVAGFAGGDVQRVPASPAAARGRATRERELAREATFVDVFGPDAACPRRGV